METVIGMKEGKEEGRRLHHIGFVVASIEKSAAPFSESAGAVWDGKIIEDPIQQAKVSFLAMGQSGEPMIELVEPAGEASPVTGFLKRGGGLHHLCYEVASLDWSLELCRKRKNLLVRAPVPAVAFGGRRIAWVYTRQKLLVEYLEAPAGRGKSAESR
jgi:methylmalonyl-CoA/ethylmalonyl-CoA epimerase